MSPTLPEPFLIPADLTDSIFARARRTWSTELVLKAGNPPTDRRCIDSEKHRRSSEISGIRHSDEILQLQQLY
jgi:hypothetical protein